MAVVFIEEVAVAANKTNAQVQTYWKESKDQAKREGLQVGSDRYWHRVHLLTKQKAGLDVS